MLSLYEKSCPQPLSLQYAQLRLCSDHQQTSSHAGWRFVDDLKPPVFYRKPVFILTLDKYTLDKFLPPPGSLAFFTRSQGFLFCGAAVAGGGEYKANAARQGIGRERRQLIQTQQERAVEGVARRNLAAKEAAQPAPGG